MFVRREAEIHISLCSGACFLFTLDVFWNGNEGTGWKVECNISAFTSECDKIQWEEEL